MHSLHWFRSDLRLDDNRSLTAAAASGELLCLYIATPAQWRLHDDAAIKLDFWRRNLQLLEERLRSQGIPLLYAQVDSYADIPALLQALLPRLKVGALHCNAEYPLNERRRDEAVAGALQARGIAMQVHDDQGLLAPGTVLNKSGQPFKVFTPFARTLRERLQPGEVPCCAAPGRQAQPETQKLAALCSLDDLAWPEPGQGWAQLWPAGEEHAWLLLRDFLATRVDAYKQQRDLPGIDGTSKLSPQLTAGVLSLRQCWQATLETEPGPGVVAWQNELLWRDFYKYVMFHFPHVCRGWNWREGLQHIPWRHDAEEFAQWREGRTGIPIVDAAMRQLLATGWMHNRLRMITAMFLTKHLLIDWRWGERWFMQHLVDGDYSANNGGWQWSASTGTDAAPYFRIFNPVTQSRRFDARGAFLRHWLPELRDLDDAAIHEPGLLCPDDYPPPMIDLGFGRERALNAFKAQP